MDLDNLVTRYKEKVDEIDTAEQLLDKYNPWHDMNKLIESFKKALDSNSKSFSWTRIDEAYKNISVTKYEKYGIPNHVKGDIENAKLYLCLTNPNIAVGAHNKEVGIADFFKFYENITTNDDSLHITQNGNLKKNKDKEFLKKHIMDTSPESSILFQELKKIRDGKKQKDTYYLLHYFANICIASLGLNMNVKKKDEVKVKTFADKLDDTKLTFLIEKVSKKIANLESYPFRSSNPNYNLARVKSDVNMFSARIIIWRIVKSEIERKNNNEKAIYKPLFIFRRFNDAWKISFEYVLQEDLNFTEEETQKLLSELHNNYFLTVFPQGYKQTFSSIGRESLFRNNNKVLKEDFDTLFFNLFSDLEDC